MVVGAEVIEGRLDDTVLVWRTSKLSTAAMVVTFLATTGLPLQQAIVLGAILSLLLYCVQAARQGSLIALVRDADGRWRTAPVPERLPAHAITVLHYSGVSLFAELPRVDQQWPVLDAAGDSATAGTGPVVILYFRGLADVPSATMIKVLERRATELHDAGGRLMIAGADSTLLHTLQATHLADTLGPDSIFAADETVFQGLDRAFVAAEQWLTGNTLATASAKGD
jgi:SulP family sulfate permease